MPISAIPELRALVYSILERPFAHTWSVQGMGFMRTYLDGKNTRLHIWDDMLRKPGVSAVHNHPWDFRSTIVAGIMTQWRYTMEKPMLAPGLKPLEFIKAQIKAGSGAHVVPGTEQNLLLYPNPIETYGAGDQYSQMKQEIHENRPVNGTVTVVSRFNFNEDPDHANVYWLKGTEFVDAEPHMASQEQIKTITQRALQNWF